MDTPFAAPASAWLPLLQPLSASPDVAGCLLCSVAGTLLCAEGVAAGASAPSVAALAAAVAAELQQEDEDAEGAEGSQAQVEFIEGRFVLVRRTRSEIEWRSITDETPYLLHVATLTGSLLLVLVGRKGGEPGIRKLAVETAASVR